jgi:hypothetical protein
MRAGSLENVGVSQPAGIVQGGESSFPHWPRKRSASTVERRHPEGEVGTLSGCRSSRRKGGQARRSQSIQYDHDCSATSDLSG